MVTRAEFEPEFCGDHHLLAEGSEGFAHMLFVQERAIELRSVKERDAMLDRRPKKRGHLLRVFGWAVGRAHSHAPQPESRYFKIAVSQFALFHLLRSNRFTWRSDQRGSLGFSGVGHRPVIFSAPSGSRAPSRVIF